MEPAPATDHAAVVAAVSSTATDTEAIPDLVGADGSGGGSNVGDELVEAGELADFVDREMANLNEATDSDQDGTDEAAPVDGIVNYTLPAPRATWAVVVSARQAATAAEEALAEKESAVQSIEKELGGLTESREGIAGEIATRESGDENGREEELGALRERLKVSYLHLQHAPLCVPSICLTWPTTAAAAVAASRIPTRTSCRLFESYQGDMCVGLRALIAGFVGN
jgi:hypothetical protein